MVFNGCVYEAYAEQLLCPKTHVDSYVRIPAASVPTAPKRNGIAAQNRSQVKWSKDGEVRSQEIGDFSEEQRQT